MYVALFIVSLLAVIMFHEYGHYATAKYFGMKVDKFFLGFGPRIWSVQRGETEYGVKAIPAGGFVKIVGMTPFEEIDEADRPRAFYTRPAWQRVVVLAAGSATHFLVAAALIFGALVFIGRPALTTTVAAVTSDSPAAAAGLVPGDVILAVNGLPADDFADVRGQIVQRGGQAVTLQLARNGQLLDKTVTLAPTNPNGERQGFLGVAPLPMDERLNPLAAAGEVVSGDFSLPRLTVLSLSGLRQALSPSALSEWIGGLEQGAEPNANRPISLVGAGQIVGAFGASGYVFGVLLLLANLNVVLGTLNMLPLPPLDGGHVAVLLVEQVVNRVRGTRGGDDEWRLNPQVLMPVALAVLLFLVTLSLAALYTDIVQPASGLLE